MDDDSTRDPQDQALLIRSLTAYADACTRPRLTPGCPYYVSRGGTATCGMQCRDLIAELGGPRADVRSVAVGGLLLTGLALPVDVAAHGAPYDAGQKFVEERLLLPPEQSTSTLLLGLRAAVRLPMLDSAKPDPARALALVEELGSRGLPAVDVIRAALLGDLSLHIAFRAVLPFFAMARALPDDLDEDVLDRLRGDAGRGWPAILGALAAAWPSPQDLIDDVARQPPPSAAMRTLGDLHAAAAAPWDQPDDMPDDAVARAAAVPEVHLAFSRLFLRRVEEWLSVHLTDDLMAFLRCDPPPLAVLEALPVPDHDRRPDELHLWLWERFVASRPADWTTGSLVLEWRLLDGQPPPGTPERRQLAERDVDPEDIAALLLARLSNRPVRRPASPGLTAALLTERAIGLLADERPQAAADIFAGLVELRPTDGDAWNNQGFCLLPTDPARGLAALQQASLFKRDYSFLNSANRCLALHLHGEDDEALSVADAALAHVPAGTFMDPAVLWAHTRGEDLRLLTGAEPHAYLRDLAAGIRAGCCRIDLTVHAPHGARNGTAATGTPTA